MYIYSVLLLKNFKVKEKRNNNINLMCNEVKNIDNLISNTNFSKTINLKNKQKNKKIFKGECLDVYA